MTVKKKAGGKERSIVRKIKIKGDWKKLSFFPPNR
jgi:hypothetical protein